MIADVLTEALLDEAEAIVHAEWMRLQCGASRDAARYAVCSEMPAARPCLVTSATLTATIGRSRQAPERCRAGWPSRGGPQRRIWPTQRSPPQVLPSSVEQEEVMP
jgi:hypothetical protein